MERKLASIQRAMQIVPIEGADAIELVRINGWQCVTKKGEFREGDLGVFLEIDAVPPDTELFQFLWTPRNAVQGETVVQPGNFRIRTMKLRGAISQGLFLPLSNFDFASAPADGEDVTALLGVEKYELPVKMFVGQDLARGPFPAFIPKTDEMRVQSVPQVLEELRGAAYVATLKYDGTSATYCIDPRDDEFHVCGRNISFKPGTGVHWNLALKYGLEERLRRKPHLALQGEICGPGIQKNRLGLKEPGLFVFNVWDIAAQKYLDHDEARAVCAELELKMVEEIEGGDTFSHTLDSLLQLAEGKYPNTGNEREGVVVRPIHETYSPTLLGRLSFKAISNRFLLKEGD